MALPAVVVGFGAYSVAAILTGLNLIGFGKSETGGKTLGIYAFVAFFALLFNSISFITQSPLGNIPPASTIQLIFALLTFLFSIVWLGFSLCLFFNWDLKFVGFAALLLFLHNLIAFIVLFRYVGVFGVVGFPILQINNVLYLFVELGFFLLTQGRISAKLQAYGLLLSGFANFAVTFYLGGALD